MAKSVYELVEERFGVRLRTVDNPETAEANIADAILLRANPMRYSFVFFNLSAVSVWIRPDIPPVDPDEGLILLPSGSVTVGFETDFTLAAREWHVIAAANNSAIYLLALEGEPGGPEA